MKQHMSLAEIFDELFPGFYTPGFWRSARWTLNSCRYGVPKYEGLIGVQISDSEVYCYGSFLRRREKDGALEDYMFKFVWEKEISSQETYAPGLCELNDMAVTFETGLGMFSAAFNESVESQGIRMTESS